MKAELVREPVEFASEGRSSGSAFPFLNIKRMLQFRLPLMVCVTILFAAPLLVVGWAITPGKYTASAVIRFLATTPRVMEIHSALETPYANFLTTQIALVQGNPILIPVLDRPGIRDLPALAGMENPLAFLKGQVGAEAHRNSELVTITCTMQDKESARVILAAIVEEYLQYALIEEAQAGGERLAALKRVRDERVNELELQLARIQELQSSVSVPTTDGAIMESDEADLYRENLVAMELDKSRLDSRIAELEANVAQLDEIESQSLDQPIFTLRIEERVSGDPRVSVLRQQLATSQASLSLLDGRLTNEAPKLKVERAKVDGLRASLAKAEHAVRGEILSATRTDFRHQVSAARREAEEATVQAGKFRDLLDEYDVRIQSATNELAEIEKLKTESLETQDVLRSVRSQIDRITLESHAPARVRLVSPATAPPGGADYGRRKKVLLLALMAALCGGVGAGFLREQTDRRIRTPEDIASVTDLPILAVVPHAKEDRMVKADSLHALVVDSPNSTSADEFRRILARILYPGDRGDTLKTVLITSPTQGDGKTVLACNLANALAQASRRVLLIDLSVRRPNIEERFKMEPAPGLSEAVLGGGSPGSYGHAKEEEHLWILGPGMRPDELVGKLGSGEMVRFLERAEREFDHVVIDTPSLLLVSDALLLAPLVDGVIVVAGVNVSNSGMIKRCLSELKQVRANIVGVVINALRGTIGGYLHSNLKLHYKSVPAVPSPREVPGAPEILDMQIEHDEDATQQNQPVKTHKRHRRKRKPKSRGGS